jgi:hypothetical protein
MEPMRISPKSRLVAALLCLLLGSLGVHRFYVGKIGTGVLMILTLGGLGIWTLIDLVFVLVGSFTDKEGRRVFRWVEPGAVTGVPPASVDPGPERPPE